MNKNIGYMVRSGSEPIKCMMDWYTLDSLPKSKAAVQDDINQTFHNINPRTVRVYKVVLVPVGKPIKRPSRNDDEAKT